MEPYNTPTRSYELELSDEEVHFLTFAVKDTADFLIDKLRWGEAPDDGGPEVVAKEDLEKIAVSNFMVNAKAEIERLKKELAERDEVIAKVKDQHLPQTLVRMPKAKSAPYGLKKDGTPKKRPGRPSTKKK